MDEIERRRLRREILADLVEVFAERLAAAEWGRLLVEIVDDERGGWRVGSLDVEDIVGDEAAVESAFGEGRPVDLLPMLTEAVVALSALDGADPGDTLGGTFVRADDGGLAFLPGLVRAPSAWFERQRTGCVEWLTARHAALPFSLDHVARVDLDVAGGGAAFFDPRGAAVGRASVVLVGGFSRVSRAWTWAWHMHTLPEAARAACKALVDGLPERDAWEISTAQFGGDEPSATLLCAMVCHGADRRGVVRMPHADGAFYLLLGEAHAASADP